MGKKILAIFAKIFCLTGPMNYSLYHFWVNTCWSYIFQGDSGGPLMYTDSSGHWTVVGVMSSGSEGCDGQQSQVNRYAKVSTSREWIDSVIHPSWDWPVVDPFWSDGIFHPAWYNDAWIVHYIFQGVIGYDFPVSLYFCPRSLFLPKQTVQTLMWYWLLTLSLLVVTFRLLTTFPNILDPDQDWQNIGPDLYPNSLTFW